MQGMSKIVTANDMLSHETGAAIHLTVNGAQTYDDYRSTLRTSIQYLVGHGVSGRKRGGHGGA